MKVVFVSNYFNHHQRPFCEALKTKCDSFFFVSTTVMREERRKLGYAIEEPGYVIRAFQPEGLEQAKKELKRADVVFYGSAEGELSKPEYYRGKTVLYYSERIYKRGCRRYLLPMRALRFFYRCRWRQRSCLLCASAYAAYDYSRSRTFLNRYYRWGYFPEAKQHDLDELFGGKTENKLLWAGRLIDWKHPEIAVETAATLHREGFRFTLDIIGSGNMEEELARMIESKGLRDVVRLRGSMSPDQTRACMEQAEIFLLTSDKQEGWGAVLNEAMNSGCAVVASRAAGSAPFLIRDGENGLLCDSGSLDDFVNSVRQLLQNRGQRETMGRNAYFTIAELWNAEVAASRWLKLAESTAKGEKQFSLYEDGPCSKAVIIKDN